MLPTEVIFVYYVLVFVLGTFIGSFLNLISDRVLTGETFVRGRSHCDHCKKTLEPKNLVPVLSFLIQGGKCDKCKTKLSWYYPASEMLTGVLFIYAAFLSTIFLSPTPKNLVSFLFLIGVFCFFTIMLLTDAKEFIIPDKVVFAAIAFVMVFLILTYSFDIVSLYLKFSHDSFGAYLIKSGYWTSQVFAVLKAFGLIIMSSFAIAGFFLFLVLITRGRGMGAGDIKLGFLLGLVNGFPLNIIAIFLGFVLGAVYSLFLIVFRKTTIKDTIAFGPFLILGSLICLLYGSIILNWYIHLL